MEKWESPKMNGNFCYGMCPIACGQGMMECAGAMDENGKLTELVSFHRCMGKITKNVIKDHDVCLIFCCTSKITYEMI